MVRIYCGLLRGAPDPIAVIESGAVVRLLVVINN